MRNRNFILQYNTETSNFVICNQDKKNQNKIKFLNSCLFAIFLDFFYVNYKKKI